jgi:hypothetical protein
LRCEIVSETYVKCLRIVVLPALIHAEGNDCPGNNVGSLSSVSKIEGAAAAGDVGAGDVVLGDCLICPRRKIRRLFDASGYVTD